MSAALLATITALEKVRRREDEQVIFTVVIGPFHKLKLSSVHSRVKASGSD